MYRPPRLYIECGHRRDPGRPRHLVARLGSQAARPWPRREIAPRSQSMWRPQLRGFGTFEAVWFGQLISYVGSGLTNFALGVWVFQRTGSVTQFALIAFFARLPGLPAAPFAPALAPPRAPPPPTPL